MENLIIKEISRRAEQLIRYHAEQLLEAPIPLDKQPSMNDAAAVITSVRTLLCLKQHRHR